LPIVRQVSVLRSGTGEKCHPTFVWAAGAAAVLAGLRDCPAARETRVEAAIMA
jgi:hypothetical protein